MSSGLLWLDVIPKLTYYSAVDALHVATAVITAAEEIVTTERPASPVHRVTGIRIVSIHE